MKYDEKEEKELLEETNKFIGEMPLCFKSIPPMYETLYNVVEKENERAFDSKYNEKSKMKIKSIYNGSKK